MSIDIEILEALRWPLEAVGLLGLIGLVLLAAMNYARLPGTVPHHFGITGRPDRHGGRWILLLMCAIALAMYAGMSAGGDTFGLLTGQAAAKPGEALMLAWTKGVLMLTLCHCVRSMIRVARGEAGRMNVAVLWGLIALTLVPVVAGVAR
ncbi:MAG: hypothetical protein C0504_11455 [Candidatus Solibacter sp.]|nr:hypothetical protein [Candidatus Solibacter sp.]